jgi:chromosome segregation ATPase
MLKQDLDDINTRLKVAQSDISKLKAEDIKICTVIKEESRKLEEVFAEGKNLASKIWALGNMIKEEEKMNDAIKKAIKEEEAIVGRVHLLMENYIITADEVFTQGITEALYEIN